MDANGDGTIDLEEWTTCMTPDLKRAIYRSLANPDKLKGFQPLVETRLKLYNKPLDWTKQTKYLGVIIDHKLTFVPHINSKIASAKRTKIKFGHHI